MSAVKTATKQRGKPFEPGKSGNPNGRPKGSRNKTTLAAQALIDGKADAIMAKVLELALAGDGPILRAVLDRICPIRKDSPITLAGMPVIEGVADLHRATAKLLEAVAKGVITPSEASILVGLVEAHGRALAMVDDGEDVINCVVPTPEEMAQRAKERLASIQKQREEFVPARKLEIQELKEKMERTNNAFAPDAVQSKS